VCGAFLPAWSTYPSEFDTPDLLQIVNYFIGAMWDWMIKAGCDMMSWFNISQPQWPTRSHQFCNIQHEEAISVISWCSHCNYYDPSRLWYAYHHKTYNSHL